jgi:hypothetical protein
MKIVYCEFGFFMRRLLLKMNIKHAVKIMPPKKKIGIGVTLLFLSPDLARNCFRETHFGGGKWLRTETMR